MTVIISAFPAEGNALRAPQPAAFCDFIYRDFKQMRRPFAAAESDLMENSTGCAAIFNETGVAQRFTASVAECNRGVEKLGIPGPHAALPRKCDSIGLLGLTVAALRAGERLRQIRTHLGFTTRDVAELSRNIAASENNEEFSVSHARLIQIENDESTPSIYKLFTLSAIYGQPFSSLVSLYVELDAAAKYQFNLRPENTRLASFDTYQEERPVSFPVRFDPGFKVEKTNLLSRMVEIWGEVPVGLLRHLNIRKQRYGFIGLKDYTMYPLLRPGSFVQIDEQQKAPAYGAYRSEFDRPIWFLELRNGYLCSWCELRRDRILSIPHPLSPCRTQEFAFPDEAEIVGRVTAVAARLVNIPEPPPAPPAALPGQS